MPAASQTILSMSLELPVLEGTELEMLDLGQPTAIVRTPKDPSRANCRAAEDILCRSVLVINGQVFNSIKPEFLQH